MSHGPVCVRLGGPREKWIRLLDIELLVWASVGCVAGRFVRCVRRDRCVWDFVLLRTQVTYLYTSL